MFDIQATTKSKYYDHIVLLYLESRRCRYWSIIFACFYLYITVVIFIDYSDIGLYDDTTNQLPRSDFCVHRDFPRITIGVRDGRAQSSGNVSVLSDMTSKIWADFAKDWHKIGILRTDIFFTRTTKPICNFANSIVLMFNINMNYCHEADAALKKNHVSYVLQINTNIQFTIKYTSFSTQHVLCNFANSIVLMFNINMNYTTARMDYAISARPSRTPIVIPNLVSVLSKICPNFAGHVWQDWHISRTLILYKQTWNMLSKLDFSLFCYN
jgi:hypothetical protein